MEEVVAHISTISLVIYATSICGVMAASDDTSTFAIGSPLDLWRNPDANSDVFKKYLRLFFYSVPSYDSKKKPLAFYSQFPPVRGPLNVPEDFLLRISPVDFLNADNLESSKIANVLRREDKLAEKAAAAAAAGNGDELLVNKDILKVDLTEMLSMPRNKLTHPDNRGTVAGYLYQKMGRQGLLVGMQDFDHELPITRLALEMGETLTPMFESGTNIIGILQGKHFLTTMDRPVLIGAHWDVIANTSGFNDNGSGVAALLEVMRVLSSAKCFQPDYSIFFVAFDSEESGCFGSLEFVQKFLMPEVIRPGAELQGAFILDTILSVDRKPNTQDISESWNATVPDTLDRIEKNNRTGDFLAVFARSNANDMTLLLKLKKYFRRDNFGLEEFKLTKLPQGVFPSPEELIKHAYFWLSDNSRFWFYQEDNKPYSFPSVVLTDTAFHRGYMRKCYHQQCDQVTNMNVTQLNFDFVANITQALVYAVADMVTEDGRESSCRLREFGDEEPLRTDGFAEEEAQEVTTKMTEEEQDLNQEEQVPNQKEEHQVPREEEEEEEEHLVQSHEGGKVPSQEGDVQIAAAVEKYDNLRQMVEGLVSTLKGALATYASSSLNDDGEEEGEIDEVEDDVPSAAPSSSPSSKTTNIGTQINIGSVNVDLTSDAEGDWNSADELLVRPNVVLGSGGVEPGVLTDIIRGYYSAGGDGGGGGGGGGHGDDRRMYKGKHKNSPMLIKLVPSRRK